MCPESRAHLARGSDAKVGEQITMGKFTAPANHGGEQFTMYARTSDPTCPICLPDGSTLNFTSLPAPVQKRVGTRLPQTAVLVNGTAYVSSFLFKNGVTITIDELHGAVGEVSVSAAEIDHETSRVLGEVGQQLTNERPAVAVAAPPRRMPARTVGAVGHGW